jgi:small subunit ribosomal protein S9
MRHNNPRSSPLSEEFIYATGKRKSAVARVRLKPGSGKVTVNGQDAPAYFCSAVLMLKVNQPFEALELLDRYDIVASVHGGGIAGQAGALRHGISRCLERFDVGNRPKLKKGGFLTRDARVKERKKYGQRGARARFQFSKR